MKFLFSLYGEKLYPCLSILKEKNKVRDTNKSLTKIDNVLLAFI